MSIFSSFSLFSISPHLHFLSPPAIVEAPFISYNHYYRLLTPPSAHSNPKLLKSNRRSRFGEALSAFHHDDDDEDEVMEDSNLSSVVVDGDKDDKDDDDDDGVPWFNDDEDEFAEPANLNRGEQRSQLLAATKLRPGSPKKTSSVGTKADGKGKVGFDHVVECQCEDVLLLFGLKSLPLLPLIAVGRKERSKEEIFAASRGVSTRY